MAKYFSEILPVAFGIQPDSSSEGLTKNLKKGLFFFFFFADTHFIVLFFSIPLVKNWFWDWVFLQIQPTFN